MDLFTCFLDFKLYLATNHISLIADWLRNKGIYKKFNNIFISGELNLQKPYDSFFSEVINRTHLKPEQILFVDDNIENVIAAQNNGLQSFQLKSKENLCKKIQDFLNYQNIKS